MGDSRVVIPNLKPHILVVDDDPASLFATTEILKSFNFEVATSQGFLDAISILHKHQNIDLVLCELHIGSMSGIEFIHHVKKEFKIPIILMSDNRNLDIAPHFLNQGATYFMIKPPNVEDFEKLWQYVVSNKNGKSVDVSIQRSKKGKEVVVTEDSYDDYIHSSSASLNGNILCSNNHKRKLITLPEDIEGGHTELKWSKKLIWTTSLHNKFVDAVNLLGLNNAAPKKIKQYMNVPGLKRENIASHLQKYRLYLKKREEKKDSLVNGIPENWNENPYRSHFALSEFSSGLLNSPNARSPVQQPQPQPPQQPPLQPPSATPLLSAHANYNFVDQNSNKTLRHNSFVVVDTSAYSMGQNILNANHQGDSMITHNSTIVQPFSEMTPMVDHMEVVGGHRRTISELWDSIPLPGEVRGVWNNDLPLAMEQSHCGSTFDNNFNANALNQLLQGNNVTNGNNNVPFVENQQVAMAEQQAANMFSLDNSNISVAQQNNFSVVQQQVFGARNQFAVPNRGMNNMFNSGSNNNNIMPVAQQVLGAENHFAVANQAINMFNSDSNSNLMPVAQQVVFGAENQFGIENQAMNNIFNLDSNPNIMPVAQQVFGFENNASATLQVTGSSVANQEMPGFNMLGNSSFGFQDLALANQMNNLSLDDYGGLFTSFSSNNFAYNGSNNNYNQLP